MVFGFGLKVLPEVSHLKRRRSEEEESEDFSEHSEHPEHPGNFKKEDPVSHAVDDDPDDEVGANFCEASTEAEKTVSAICVGAAGSGKTTFIQYMTNVNERTLKRDTFGASAMSVTTEVHKYEPFVLKNIMGVDRLRLQFWDTVGLGAADIIADEEAVKMVEGIAREPELHHVLIFQKLERLRKDVLDDLRQIFIRFQGLGASTEHLKVILTFSAQYTTGVVNDFINALYEELKTFDLDIDKKNIFSINFARMDELEKPFRKVFRPILERDHKIALEMLCNTPAPFCPQKKVMDDPGTKKRIARLAKGKDDGLISSFVTMVSKLDNTPSNKRRRRS